MNRFALTLILAAVPLFAAGMLAQSEDVSSDASSTIYSASANSTKAKQFFRGTWIDGSNFTQDASSITNEFSAVGNFHSAKDQVDFTISHIASALSNSRSHFQSSEKKLRLADSKVARAEAQLAQLNALYASLTRGGRTYSAEV
jgi:peptidoglycan hydrolase CwlO-like protein